MKKVLFFAAAVFCISVKAERSTASHKALSFLFGLVNADHPECHPIAQQQEAAKVEMTKQLLVSSNTLRNTFIWQRTQRLPHSESSKSTLPDVRRERLLFTRLLDEAAVASVDGRILSQIRDPQFHPQEEKGTTELFNKLLKNSKNQNNEKNSTQANALTADEQEEIALLLNSHSQRVDALLLGSTLNTITPERDKELLTDISSECTFVARQLNSYPNVKNHPEIVSALKEQSQKTVAMLQFVQEENEAKKIQNFYIASKMKARYFDREKSPLPTFVPTPNLKNQLLIKVILEKRKEEERAKVQAQRNAQTAVRETLAVLQQIQELPEENHEAFFDGLSDNQKENLFRLFNPEKKEERPSNPPVYEEGTRRPPSYSSAVAAHEEAAREQTTSSVSSVPGYEEEDRSAPPYNQPNNE